MHITSGLDRHNGRGGDLRAGCAGKLDGLAVKRGEFVRFNVRHVDAVRVSGDLGPVVIAVVPAERQQDQRFFVAGCQLAPHDVKAGADGRAHFGMVVRFDAARIQGCKIVVFTKLVPSVFVHDALDDGITENKKLTHRFGVLSVRGISSIRIFPSEGTRKVRSPTLHIGNARATNGREDSQKRRKRTLLCVESAF